MRNRVSKADRQRGELPDIRLVEGRVIYNFSGMPPAKAAHLIIVCEPDGTVRVSIPEDSLVLPESDVNRRTQR